MSKFKRLLSALVCAAMLMTGPLAVSEEVISEIIPEESIVPMEETAPIYIHFIHEEQPVTLDS